MFAFIKFFLFQDADGKKSYAVYWEPPPEDIYKWKNKHPQVPKSLRIYECHVGISGLEPKISSFKEFTSKVTPRNGKIFSLYFNFIFF